MAETVLNPQEPEVASKRLETAPQSSNHNPKRAIGIVLSILMLALTAYVLKLQNLNNSTLAQSTQLALTSSHDATVNYMTYVGKYKETKIELDETTRKLVEVNRQLNEVSAELTSTKGMLNQTQGMLAEAQQENAKLKQELQGLESLRTSENVQNIDQLQTKIQGLKDRDSEVSEQLSDLKTQLRAYEGQFNNLDEGRSLIILFQTRINLVKAHMRYLKQQAFFARVAAQKEKDRLAQLNGNSGYMIRDGKLQNPDGTKKSFAINVQIVQ